jgi:hypothetical protein
MSGEESKLVTGRRRGEVDQAQLGVGATIDGRGRSASGGDGVGAALDRGSLSQEMGQSGQSGRGVLLVGNGRLGREEARLGFSPMPNKNKKPLFCSFNPFFPFANHFKFQTKFE